MGNRPSEGGRFGKAPATLERTARRVGSSFEIAGPLLPNQQPGGDMLMCVHCQMHWIIQPGSGMERGFCLNCNGPTCGKQHCETNCVPWERAIENKERLDRSQMQGARIL